jgi:protein involved in polysaccharide export with SLBB domain
MKELKSTLARIAVAVGIICAGFAFTGCQSGPEYADLPIHTPSTASQSNSQSHYVPPSGETDRFQVGDVVRLTFTSPEAEAPLAPISETIKDDGRITPTMIGPVMAAGKTQGQLQGELQELYQKYYRHVTVTVTTDPRFYYVLGDVKSPGPKNYLGETDIVKAISSAGDFTDFANKKKVQLTHGKKTQTINVQDIIHGKARTVQVYPGDTIFVYRRVF